MGLQLVLPHQRIHSWIGNSLESLDSKIENDAEGGCKSSKDCSYSLCSYLYANIGVLYFLTFKIQPPNGGVNFQKLEL